MISLQQSASDEAIARAHTLLESIKELPEAERGTAELTVNSILTPALMTRYGWASTGLGETANRWLEILRTVGDSLHHVPRCGGS